MGEYFQNYAEIEVQRRMVSDGCRTDAFADAIREMVRPGDVVVDVGTGTGVLAMLAARAGARVVHAVDASDIAHFATKLVAANGLDDIVHVTHGSASRLEIAEPADVIMSEWLGSFGFVEGMLADVLEARDRLLKPGGQMLPGGVKIMLAPMDDPVMYERNGPGFWRRPIHNLDFRLLEAAELRQGRSMPLLIESASLLSPGAAIGELDNLCVASAADQWTSGEVEFDIERDGVLNGFAGWFVARLSSTVFLDTGPLEPETHWQQTYLACRPQLLTEGTRLTVGYQLAPHPDDRREVELTLRVGDDETRYTVS